MIEEPIINGSANRTASDEAPAQAAAASPAASPAAASSGGAAQGARAERYYEHRHIVSFEETNLVGNVYYVNHLRWQGRCREMFLYDHGVDVLKDFAEGFAMVTVRVACDYLSELLAFDTLSIRMRLGELVQNRITLRFEYWKLHNPAPGTQPRPSSGPEQWELVARGEQQVACMRRDGDRLVAAPVPEKLREVLKRYEA